MSQQSEMDAQGELSVLVGWMINEAESKLAKNNGQTVMVPNHVIHRIANVFERAHPGYLKHLKDTKRQERQW